MEFKYHLGYKTTNLINGKFYYGIHSTNKEPGTDGYLGSGSAIRSAIRKYGRKNFKYEIVGIFNTRAEASKWEQDILTEELINSPDCYNLKSGGDSRDLEGVGYFSDETLTKMSVSHKGVPRNPEWARKAAATRKANGYTMPESVRQKIRKSRLGTHLKPESIEKMKATKKVRGYASSRPEVIVKIKATKLKNGTLGYNTKGKIHINNGICQRFIRPEEWPEFEKQGWNRGILKSTAEKISTRGKGRKSPLKGKPRSKEVLDKIKVTKAVRKDRYESRAGWKRFVRGDERRLFKPDQFEQALRDGWVALRPKKEWLQEGEETLVARFLQEVDQHPVPEKQGQMLGNCLFVKDGVRKFFKPREFKQILQEGWWLVRPSQIFWW